MPFLLDSGQKTALQKGDIIVLDRRDGLLSILRAGGLCVLPNVISKADDKLILPRIFSEVPSEFTYLCRLVANAAGLTIGEIREIDEQIRIRVEE